MKMKIWLHKTAFFVLDSIKHTYASRIASKESSLLLMTGAVIRSFAVCQHATGNNGPAFMLSNARTPKHKKKLSHASALTCTLFFIASCDLLQMNRASHLESMKLLRMGASPNVHQ